MNISVFNGAGQVDYMFGLVSGLAKNENDRIDVLDVERTQYLFDSFNNVHYYPVFKTIPRSSSFLLKFSNLSRFYFLQTWFLMSHKPRIVHFQWLDRVIFLDRIILPLIARLFRHKVVLTVHNINAGKRDNRDTRTNRLTLKILYRLAHKLIVHTTNSKTELTTEFPIADSKIAIIRHGMNNRVLQTGINTANARKEFQISANEKVILFFGNIDYYKGLDILIDAFESLPEEFRQESRLLIAGNSKSADFKKVIQQKIDAPLIKERVLAKVHYIQDEDVEKYFMAADCIVLPYRNIYQSGVIFMAYTFGLPIIVSDIGNFKNDMVEGETGFLIPANEPKEIGKTLLKYFDSRLYRNLPESREKIKSWAWENYSWETIGAETRKLYESIS